MSRKRVTVPCVVSICRVTSNGDPENEIWSRFELRDDNVRRFINVSMTPEDFGLALTGLSDRPGLFSEKCVPPTGKTGVPDR